MGSAADTAPTVPANLVVGVTGHRDVNHPQVVSERLAAVLERLAPRRALCGGAQGADSLFASAALAAAVPLEVVLPNRWYLHRYPDAVPAELLDAAALVRFAVERPEVADWARRWSDERWFVDNFVRNTVLVDAADLLVVVSSQRPLEVAARRRGGTAHCVRTWAQRRGTRVLWVPDDPHLELRWAPPASTSPARRAAVSAEPQLFSFDD